MRAISNQIRYQIIAQCRGDRLVVSILQKDLCFIKTARQIFNDPMLLGGFSQQEAALIGYIVGKDNDFKLASKF